MTGHVSRFFVASALGVVAAIAVAVSAIAEEGAMKHRQSVMKAIGGHMGAMGSIVKGEVGFKEDLQGHAHALAELAKIAPRVFPKGSNVKDSAALPAIWEKPDEFKQRLASLASESQKLAEVAKKGDMDAFKAQFAALGKNGCTACHDTFRQKK
jgi:cytochrome c556